MRESVGKGAHEVVQSAFPWVSIGSPQIRNQVSKLGGVVWLDSKVSGSMFQLLCGALDQVIPGQHTHTASHFGSDREYFNMCLGCVCAFAVQREKWKIPLNTQILARTKICSFASTLNMLRDTLLFIQFAKMDEEGGGNKTQLLHDYGSSSNIS